MTRWGRWSMLLLIVAIITLAVVVLFSVQNASPVAVSFLLWQFEASLAVVIVLSFLLGMVAGMVILWWIRLRRYTQKKKAPESDGVSTNEPL